MNTPGLVLESVACTRGGRTLFEGLDLTLSAGQWLQVRGANGAGKTTTFYLVVGLCRPDQGEVFLDGESITGINAWHPQNMCLNP